MIPGSVRFTSIMMAICTMVWPICVVSMAASRPIRSMALRLIFSHRRGLENSGWRRQLQSWGESIVLVVYIHHAAYLLNSFVAGISCSWPWIRWFVLSLSSTLRCRYGTPPAKGHLMNCSMQKSICKYYHFLSPLACAWPIAFFISATLSKELSWRRFSCWTRISFIWSTTFSGIWDSKRRLRPTR